MATIYHLGGYGSGKSYKGGLCTIVDELVYGTRGVVTNLALLQESKVLGKVTSRKAGLGSLNKYIHDKFPKLDCRVIQRVRILDEDDVPHFFCHRVSRGGLHYDIPVPDADAEKRGARPDFSMLRDDGCLFVIDEFHDYFNARLWAEVGRSVGWYKNQQRKIGDDIHACTPQIDEVDKQLRTIGHEYRVYNNLGLRKVRGVVLPQTFICTVFSSLDAVKRKGQPLSKFPFTLDVALANCYDTAKGVRGLQGGSADIGKRPKGIHWSVPVIIFFTVILGIIYAGFYARRHFVKSNSRPTPQTQTVSTNEVKNVSATAPRPAAVLLASASTPPPESRPVPPSKIYCTGWVCLGSNYVAWLSDGTEYDSADHELGWIRKRTIQILGREYQIKSLPPSSYASAVSATPQFPGIVTPPRPVNQIEVIPFGDSRRTSPLPDRSDADTETVAERMGSASVPETPDSNTSRR